MQVQIVRTWVLCTTTAPRFRLICQAIEKDVPNDLRRSHHPCSFALRIGAADAPEAIHWPTACEMF